MTTVEPRFFPRLPQPTNGTEPAEARDEQVFLSCCSSLGSLVPLLERIPTVTDLSHGNETSLADQSITSQRGATKDPFCLSVSAFLASQHIVIGVA